MNIKEPTRNDIYHTSKVVCLNSATAAEKLNFRVCGIGEGDGTVVYAYGSTEMTILAPGDSTSALTNQMTMKSISNAEYAAIDDINITITGYAMGTEDMSTNPVDSWKECKTIGNIQ